MRKLSLVLVLVLPTLARADLYAEALVSYQDACKKSSDTNDKFVGSVLAGNKVIGSYSEVAYKFSYSDLITATNDVNTILFLGKALPLTSIDSMNNAKKAMDNAWDDYRNVMTQEEKDQCLKNVIYWAGEAQWQATVVSVNVDAINYAAAELAYLVSLYP